MQRSGYVNMTYGYQAGSDHVGSVGGGGWLRSQAWEAGREAVSTVTQSWNGGTLVAQYTSDYDWRLNRDAVTLTGTLASQQGHAGGLRMRYVNKVAADTWDREEVREARTEQLSSGAEMTDRRRAWTYDAAWNRTAETRGGVTVTNGTINALNQLTAQTGGTSTSVTYRDNGNVAEDNGWEYTFDAENRLSGMRQRSGGTQRLEFRYDYVGRRIEKKVFATLAATTPTQHVKYVYDGWNLIAEVNGATPDTVLRTFTWGLDASETLGGAGGVGGLLRMEEGNTSYYPVYDPSHNVTGLLRVEAGVATLVASYQYGPFGEKLGADWAAPGFVDRNPFRFSTKYTDVETGLVYYGHRYYDPKLGRFLGRDPLGEAGGNNLYGFVKNNPVNRWDILGMVTPEDARKLLKTWEGFNLFLGNGDTLTHGHSGSSVDEVTGA